MGTPGRRAVRNNPKGTIPNTPGVDLPTIMEIPRHTRISPTRYVKSRSHPGKDPRRTGDTFAPAPRTCAERATGTGTETVARPEHGAAVTLDKKAKAPGHGE